MARRKVPHRTVVSRERIGGDYQWTVRCPACRGPQPVQRFVDRREAQVWALAHEAAKNAPRSS